MWHEIADVQSLADLVYHVSSFHDSCIKEMKYLSGAYVGEDLGMYPFNDRRILKVLIQRQSAELPVIELEFRGLKYLKLFPSNEHYTCESFDSTLMMHDGDIYWCDCGGVSEQRLKSYDGTLICASGLRWRAIDGGLGEKEFYSSN